jgi:Spy/CpxP family protein refolding chaperone
MGRTVTILLALSLAANVFLGGFVAGRIAGPNLPGFERPGGERHGHGRVDVYADLERLPPAARDRLKALIRENRGRFAETFREGRALHQEFIAVLTADPFDRAAAEAVAARIEAFQRERRPSMPRLVIETMDGLSLDDRRALAALVERRMSDDLMGGGRRGHRRGRCDGPPPPPGESPPQ